MYKVHVHVHIHLYFLYLSCSDFWTTVLIQSLTIRVVKYVLVSVCLYLKKINADLSFIFKHSHAVSGCIHHPELHL